MAEQRSKSVCSIYSEPRQISKKTLSVKIYLKIEIKNKSTAIYRSSIFATHLAKTFIYALNFGYGTLKQACIPNTCQIADFISGVGSKGLNC